MGLILPSFKTCVRCGRKILVADLSEQVCSNCERFLRAQEAFVEHPTGVQGLAMEDEPDAQELGDLTDDLERTQAWDRFMVRTRAVLGKVKLVGELPGTGMQAVAADVDRLADIVGQGKISTATKWTQDYLIQEGTRCLDRIEAQLNDRDEDPPHGDAAFVKIGLGILAVATFLAWITSQPWLFWLSIIGAMVAWLVHVLRKP